MNDLTMKNCRNFSACCCSVRLTLAIVLLALALVVSNAAWFFHAIMTSPRVASSVSGSQRITVDGERVSPHA